MAAATRSKASSKLADAMRLRKTRSASGTQSPWWLRADIEFCAFCYQRYAYGTGHRCVACDVAVCGFCVEYRGRQAWCPEC